MEPVVIRSSWPVSPGHHLGFQLRGLQISLGALLILVPQLLGSVFPWGIACACILASVSLGVAVQVERKAEAMHMWSWLEILWAVSLLWTLMQLVPLPFSIIESLRPELAALLRMNAEAFGTPVPKFAALSFDPGGTALEIAKGLAILSAMFSMRVFVRRTNQRAGLKLVAYAIVAMILVALLHKLAGTDAVFGIYKPAHAYSRLLAPLMNENHLGGLCVFGVPLLIGVASSSPNRARKYILILFAFLGSMVCLLTLSRGAILMLALVLAALSFRLLWRRRESRLWSTLLVVLALGLGSLVLLQSSAFSTRLSKEFSYTHNVLTKLDVVKASLPIIKSHPWLGTGRGSYAAVAVRESGSQRRPYHPENFLAQWATEWGVVFASLFSLALFILLFRAWLKADSTLRFAAVLGISALLVHNLVDFSLEIMGVAILFWSCVAIVCNERSKFNLSHRTLITTAVVTALFGIATLFQHQRDLYTLDIQLRRALSSANDQALQRIALSARRLHPVDPLVAIANAMYKVHVQPNAAAPAISFALATAPKWEASHLIAAEWLATQGYERQAMLEIRLAEQENPGSGAKFICEMLKTTQNPQTVILAAPRGAAGAEFLDRISYCDEVGDELSEALDAHAQTLDPKLAGPALRQADRLEVRGNRAEAIKLLYSVPMQGRQETRVRVALASALLRDGKTNEAAKVAKPLLDQEELSLEAWELCIQVAGRTSELGSVESLIDRWRMSVGSDRRLLSQMELSVSQLYERLGLLSAALTHAEKALDLSASQHAVSHAFRIASALNEPVRSDMLRRRWCPTYPQVTECSRLTPTLP